jgi:hypothetical protein
MKEEVEWTAVVCYAKFGKSDITHYIGILTCVDKEGNINIPYRAGDIGFEDFVNNEFRIRTNKFAKPNTTIFRDNYLFGKIISCELACPFDEFLEAINSAQSLKYNFVTCNEFVSITDKHSYMPKNMGFIVFIQDNGIMTITSEDDTDEFKRLSCVSIDDASFPFDSVLDYAICAYITALLYNDAIIVGLQSIDDTSMDCDYDT